MTKAAGNERRPKQGFTAKTVYFFEQYVPDPFVLAIGLTVIVIINAMVFAPNHSVSTIVESWYAGVFNIFGFAFQMIMILVSGYALAQAPILKRGLQKFVSRIQTANQAAVLTFLVTAAATWLNWGFGMVIGALLAREIARRIRLDFAWLVAAAYSGWMIWSAGLSGTIPLTQATPGNALNIVEQITGKIVPFSETIFAPFTLIPTVIFLAVMPVILIVIKPTSDVAEIFSPEADPLPRVVESNTPASFAKMAESSPAANIILVAIGVTYVVESMMQKGSFRFDVNAVIFLFIIVGLCLHGSPLNYATAVRDAAKQTGSIMLQYPIYGGIMGIMSGTGLAQTISTAVTHASTTHTLPFLSYLASILISFLVPSGGGHWAVQGPFTIPAAVKLGASIPATAMSVGFGEQVAVMLHPMWAAPMVAIAGVGVQRVLGFTTITFLVGLILYGMALLVIT